MKEIRYDEDTVIACKDHLISGENFFLLYHEVYNMLITNSQPNLEKLPGTTKANNVFLIPKREDFGSKKRITW